MEHLFYLFPSPPACEPPQGPPNSLWGLRGAGTPFHSTPSPAPTPCCIRITVPFTKRKDNAEVVWWVRCLQKCPQFSTPYLLPVPLLYDFSDHLSLPLESVLVLYLLWPTGGRNDTEPGWSLGKRGFVWLCSSSWNPVHPGAKRPELAGEGERVRDADKPTTSQPADT